MLLPWRGGRFAMATNQEGRHRMLVDDFLPTFDVSDSVGLVVDADVMTTWEALMRVDLIDVGRKRPMVAVLGGLRALPEIVSQALHGEFPLHAPERMRLHDMLDLPLRDGGWVLLGERHGDEIALGLVGKFWRPVIKFAEVSADEFRTFAKPGFAKTVYALSVRGVEAGRTLLTGVMRTATTDEQARRWFRRYWTFGVGSGAHVMVNGLLELTREIAEARP
jgi:hypothetical protein